MTDFFKKIRDVGPTVDHLLEGVEQKRSEFSSYKGLEDNAKVTEGIKRLKRCFDLADQLFDQTLVQREVLIAACERLKQSVDDVYDNIKTRVDDELNSYYNLARGNVRFRQALILDRWQPLPFQMCQDARGCFAKVKDFVEEKDTEKQTHTSTWLARLMAAKCEREMEKYLYHHSDNQNFLKENNACKAFESIVRKISPDNMELGKIALDAVINMGRCLRNQMKYQEAIPYFAAVCAELAPKCGDGEGKNIIAQQELPKKYGEIDAGIKDNLHTAVENLQQKWKKDDPQYLQALVNLVACLTDGPREYAMAQNLALHVLERISGENIDMQNNLGRLYRKRKDFLLAEESYRKVMENLKMARRKEVSYFVDETASLNRYAELELVKCFTEQHNFKKALEQLNRLLGFYDKDPEVLLWKGLCHRNQGQLTQAVEVLKDLCDAEKVIRPGTVGLKARYAMGTCYLLSAPAQAKVWFEQIVQAEPSDVPARSDLGWCQQLLGEYDRAIATYQRVQEFNEKGCYPRRDLTWISVNNNLGMCQLYLGQATRALRFFIRVLMVERTNFRALCGAACCLRRFKRATEAVKWAQKAREVAPGDPHVESEYVLSLLSNVEHYKDELSERVLNSERVFPQEMCIEALAKLAKHVEDADSSFAPFCALRPMKWEAASQQVEDLVNSTEFQTLGKEQQGELLAYIYRLHYAMEQIKTTLRLTRKQMEEKSCWHYTGVGTLQRLLINQGKRTPKFRLTNVAYMNDSAEGEPFGTLLKECGSNSAMLQAYGLLPGGEAPNDSNLRNVYLTSLCTEDDYIYMWAIYADKGTGCSLKFDENFFDVKDSYPQGYIPFHEEENSYPLYRIVYLPDQKGAQDKKTELESSLKDLVSILGKIYQALPEEQQQSKGKMLRAYIAAMLDQVRYLFKYDEYSSEKEVRCLVVTKDRKMEPRDRDTPHVYTEMQREIELKQVRFGPKVFKSPEKEAWIYATKRVKEVSYSNRHYR